MTINHIGKASRQAACHGESPVLVKTKGQGVCIYLQVRCGQLRWLAWKRNEARCSDRGELGNLEICDTVNLLIHNQATSSCDQTSLLGGTADRGGPAEHKAEEACGVLFNMSPWKARGHPSIVQPRPYPVRSTYCAKSVPTAVTAPVHAPASHAAHLQHRWKRRRKQPKP